MECILDNNCSEILDKDCYLLFYFTATWCKPCQRIKPMIEKLSNGLDKSTIIFYMIDIDENDEICNKFNIKSVPTFVLIKNKSVVNHCSGANIENVHRLLKDNI